MASYRPNIKTDEDGSLFELPLDAATLNGYDYDQYTKYYKTASATANEFTVTIPHVTALEDGMIIHCQFNAATASGATLNVNNLGAKGLYYRYATAITTHIAANNYVDLIYASAIDKWVMLFSYDSNTNTIAYQVRTNSAIFTNKTGYSMNRYTILCEVDGGLSGFATTIGTGSSKTTVSPKYIPGGVIKYYSTSGAIANNANFGATGLWDRYTLDLRYTFNIGTAVISSGKPVYIRMSKNTDGTLSPNYAYTSPGKHPITTALPTTADGDVYVYLGKAYSTSAIELDLCHPMYEFKNGKIQVYTGSPDVPTKTSDLTNDSNFVVDASYVHTDNNFTTTYKNAVDANSAKVSNVQADWNATTGLAVILNKPTIPTVDYPVTDVKVNNTSVVSSKIANITVPTKVSDLTNDSGYITSITSADVTSALGYTPGTSNLVIGTTATTASKGNHVHSVTATGNVSSTFTGTAATSGVPSNNTATVANHSHTHDFTPSGSINFNLGTAPSATTKYLESTNGTPSGTTTVLTGVSIVGTVSGTTLTLSITTTDTSVASSGHSHTITNTAYTTTGTGRVAYLSEFNAGTTPPSSATFSGDDGTTESTNGTGVTVPNTSHTHSVTATGNVSSTFTGTATDSGIPK